MLPSVFCLDLHLKLIRYVFDKLGVHSNGLPIHANGISSWANYQYSYPDMDTSKLWENLNKIKDLLVWLFYTVSQLMLVSWGM